MERTITIVGFGDSITQATAQMPAVEDRWLRVLDHSLCGEFPGLRFKVINAGVGGESDREKMRRFGSAVLAHAPDILLLQFGGNNTSFDKPERRVGPDEARALLQQLRAQLPASTAVVVITFPPVIDGLHGVMKREGAKEFFAEWGGLDGSVERFRELSREFASQNGYALVDLSQEMRARADLGCYILNDGVHLTVAGNRLLAALVLEHVRQIVARLDSSHAPLQPPRLA